MNKILTALLSLGLFCFALIGEASLFSIVVKENTSLPTVVGTEAVNAYYTVTNNTSTTRLGSYVKHLPSNVTQVTSGYSYCHSCGATFELEPNESCTLQLRISGAVNRNSANPHDHLFVCLTEGLACTGVSDSLDVKVLESITISPSSTASVDMANTQQFTATAHYADSTTADITSSVAWASSDMNVASISDEGLASPRLGGTSSITASLLGVTSLPATVLTVLPTYAYVAPMFHEHITICSVGFTGALSDCINHADVNRTFSGPVGVALNADRTKLYVANISYNELDYDGDGSISICPLEGGGDSFTDCTKKLDDTFRTVTSIMLNEDNTYAYITSAGSPGQSYTDASVFICPLDEDGSFDGDCVASSGSGTFRNPRSSVIDPDGKLRVVNAYNNTISLCDLSDDQSTIVSCTTITNVTFNNVQGIGYNNAGTFFYIPNVDADQISICNDNECIVQPNGQENDPEFSFSDGYDGYKVGVFMSSANGKGYITNSGNGTVSVCTINATTGLLSDCANTYVTPYPADIVLGAGT